MNINEQLESILRGYSAICTLEGYADKALPITIQQIKSLFGYEETLSLEERKETFRKVVWAWNYRNKAKYPPDVIESFIFLWSGLVTPNKMKFEECETFKIGGRLATFYKNQEKFKVSKQLMRYKKALNNINPSR